MKVETFDELAGRARITRRTLEWEIAKGNGPAVVHISARRRGILEQDGDRWLMARRHPAPGEASDKEAR